MRRVSVLKRPFPATLRTRRRMPLRSTLHGCPFFNDACEQSVQGKVACMTCHDVHNPSPVTAITEAGKKGQYLRLGEGGQGALCQSCHAEQGFIRGTPHDMSIAFPGYKNALGKAPAQSGLCGTCHLVHGAILNEYMWGAPVGTDVPKEWLKAEKPSKNIMVSLCTGCHEKDGIAAKHVPRFGLHPGAFYSRVSEIANKRLHLNICLFTPSGKSSPIGGIVCATCHNAHQWDGKKKREGDRTCRRHGRDEFSQTRPAPGFLFHLSRH